jgi:hypothetical protein
MPASKDGKPTLADDAGETRQCLIPPSSQHRPPDPLLTVRAGWLSRPSEGGWEDDVGDSGGTVGEIVARLRCGTCHRPIVEVQ